MSTSAPLKEVFTFEESPEELADRVISEAAEAEGIASSDLLSRLVERASTASRPECLQPHELSELNEIGDVQKRHIGSCNFCQTLIEQSQPSEEDASQFAYTATAHVRVGPFVKIKRKFQTSLFLSAASLALGMVRVVEVLAAHMPDVQALQTDNATIRTLIAKASRPSAARAEHRVSLVHRA